MELLVVVAILLVLVGVATPMYMNYLEQSRYKTARANAKMLATEIKNYQISHDGIAPPENTWDDLPLPPEKKPPLDPWNQPYQWAMRQIQQTDGTSFGEPVVWSVGPNGDMGPEGELSSIR
jgi:type II secretory pathway pseudopilin PulG